MNFSEIENVGLQFCSRQHSSSTLQLLLVSDSCSIIMLDFTTTQQLIAVCTNSSFHLTWFCAWHWPFVLFCQKSRRPILKLAYSKQQSFLGMWCISHGLQWHQVLTGNATLQLQIFSTERILMQTTKIMTLKVSLKNLRPFLRHVMNYFSNNWLRFAINLWAGRIFHCCSLLFPP